MTNIKKQIVQITILITVFLIPFYIFRFSVFGIKTNIFEITVLISLIVLLICREKSIKKFDLDWLLPLLFIVASAIAVYFSPDKTKALGILKGWFLVPVIFGWIVYEAFGKRDLPKISIPVFLSLLLVSKWAILQKLGFISTLFYQKGDPSFIQYINEGRAFGPFESPNYLAMFLAPMIFLSLLLVKYLKSKALKIIFYVLFLLPLLALYFSTSRGGAVALFSSMAAFLLFMFFRSRQFRRRVENIGNVLIFALIFSVTTFLVYAVRIISPNQGGDKIRFEIYRYAEQLIRQNPVSGIGLGTFQDKVGELSAGNAGFQEFGLSYALHPHNLYMAFWLNLGLFGLIIFIILIILTIKNLFKNKIDVFYKSCLFSALIAVLVHGIFDTTYFKNDLSVIFWLTYVISLKLLTDRKNEEN